MAAANPITTTELAALLPPKVRVGPFDIGIKLMDDAEAEKAEAFGQFHSNDLRIDIASGDMVPDTVSLVDTFLHEVLHAIFYTYGIKSKKTNEEALVSTIATGWTQVYRDNRWLTGWIRKGVAGRRIAKKAA